jgi:hypothetical protein
MSEQENSYRMIATLERAGVSYADAIALRSISRTLHRWNERECNGEIERDEDTGKTYAVYGGDCNGIPRQRYRTADKERGAQKRLAAIMARYPALAAYEQSDPRGCALYIVDRAKLGDRDVRSCYSSFGVGVY